MKRQILRTELLLLLWVVAFLAGHLLADRLSGDTPALDIPHLVAAASILLIALVLMRQSAKLQRRTEARVGHLSSFPQMNPNPVLEIDATGAIVFCNPAATETLARLGQDGDASAYFPDDLPVLLQELKREHEAKFERQVQAGSALFSETVQVIPASQVVRIYAFDITRAQTGGRRITGE